MSWHTTSLDPGDILIQNGDVVVGSIRNIAVPPLMAAAWRVEILWSGPGGDIKGGFSDYTSALAFVEGIEKTLAAFGVTDPRMAALVHGEPRQ